MVDLPPEPSNSSPRPPAPVEESLARYRRRLPDYVRPTLAWKPADDREGLAFWNAALDAALRVVESEYARRGGRDLHAIVNVIIQRLKMQRRVR